MLAGFTGFRLFIHRYGDLVGEEQALLIGIIGTDSLLKLKKQ